MWRLRMGGFTQNKPTQCLRVSGLQGMGGGQGCATEGWTLGPSLVLLRPSMRRGHDRDKSCHLRTVLAKLLKDFFRFFNLLLFGCYNMDSNFCLCTYNVLIPGFKFPDNMLKMQFIRQSNLWDNTSITVQYCLHISIHISTPAYRPMCQNFESAVFSSVFVRIALLSTFWHFFC